MDIQGCVTSGWKFTKSSNSQFFGGFWEMLFCDYWVKACWWWVIFSLSSCAVWFRALLPCWTTVPSPTAFFPPAQDCHVLWWCYWVWSLVFLQVPVQLNSGHKESGFPCFPEYMPKPSSFLAKVRATGPHNTDHVGGRTQGQGQGGPEPPAAASGEAPFCYHLWDVWDAISSCLPP